MELAELQALGTELIDALLMRVQDPREQRMLAKELASHCLQRAGSNRTESGRVQVPVVITQTLKPPKDKDV